MADKICLGKKTDGTRCGNPVQGRGNYCDEHKPKLMPPGGRSGVSGGVKSLTDWVPLAPLKR